MDKKEVKQVFQFSGSFVASDDEEEKTTGEKRKRTETTDDEPENKTQKTEKDPKISSLKPKSVQFEVSEKKEEESPRKEYVVNPTTSHVYIRFEDDLKFKYALKCKKTTVLGRLFRVVQRSLEGKFKYQYKGIDLDESKTIDESGIVGGEDCLVKVIKI